MKVFVPNVFTNAYLHESNMIRLYCSRVIYDSNILDIIDGFLKEYAKGLNVYNNPYTPEYYLKYSTCQQLYKYDGHGHPFSIIIRLLCEGDITIIDDKLKQIVKQIIFCLNTELYI